MHFHVGEKISIITRKMKKTQKIDRLFIILSELLKNLYIFI
ncbi:unnamed protein product, partial [marine sediment metagenome]